MCPTNDGCTNDNTYLACVAEVQRDLITTTAAVSALASFLMGLLANLPVGLAPGLGLNAYVCPISLMEEKRLTSVRVMCRSLHIPLLGVSVTLREVFVRSHDCSTCRYHGTGIITYREALAAVFLEGWVFSIYPHHAV